MAGAANIFRGLKCQSVLKSLVNMAQVTLNGLCILKSLA